VQGVPGVWLWGDDGQRGHNHLPISRCASPGINNLQNTGTKVSLDVGVSEFIFMLLEVPSFSMQDLADWIEP